MTEEEIIYSEARKEREEARKKVNARYDEDISTARRRMHEGMDDAIRVYKLRVSLTRNPHCHICNLGITRGRCNCTYKCPSTLCKGES